jgi:peptidoglycan/xylan/chitin deacetylase (PgdA/CDA1 family)
MSAHRGRRRSADVICLCYHAVSPDWPSTLAVTPAQLERQLSTLVERGWVGATFSEAVLNRPARRTVAVTFDDAFASVRERALPILQAFGIPGTVFAPTRFMSVRQPLRWSGIEHWANSPHAGELTSMDWRDLRALGDAGWEIGSHTRSHPHLTALDQTALEDELGASRTECEERLGLPCRSIAYPYGDVDQRVAATARAAGYAVGARMSSNLRPAGPHLWPRIGIYNLDSDWRFRLKLNAATRVARRSQLWPPRSRSQPAFERAGSAPRRASASS